MADISESGGYVKLHRCILNSDVIRDGAALAVFVFCMCRANNKPRMWRGISITRGMLITSGVMACEVLDMAPNTWRAALDRLVAMGMIEKWTEGRKFTRIRVVNYEKWQSAYGAGSSKIDEATDEATDEPIEQPTDNKQEGKKVRREESKNQSTATPSGESVDKPAKTPKAKPAAFNPYAITLPQSIDTPLMRSAWKAWADHRREVKKPLTPRSVDQQVRLLVELGHDRGVELIRISIRNGWLGLFPNSLPPPPKPHERQHRELPFIEGAHEAFLAAKAKADRERAEQQRRAAQ